ncbi:MAG: hypothetical protein RSA94_05125, partial [Mucinivorans sp.]
MTVDFQCRLRERSFQEQFSNVDSEKRSFQEPIKKNEVFQEKFWVTFSKVTISHGACTAICRSRRWHRA